MRQFLATAFFILAAVFAWAQTAKKPDTAKPATAKAQKTSDPATVELPTQATVDSFMKHMFSYDSNIQWQVLSIKPAMAPHVAEVIVALKNPEGQQTMRFFVTADQNWAAVGDLIPFGADPFAPANREFAARAHGPARGPADSAITIVEFSDLQCPACKGAQPIIDKLLSEFPNARFIFQNFPLEQIHPWAFKAAEYADCVARDNSDAFWKFIEVDYQNQESVTTDNADQKMKEFATQAGANAATVAACVAEPATEARVRESIALGKAVDVTGTPTLYVNGRRIQNVSGVPFELLKQLVQGTPK
jgi:protein-disulfide isomerase